MGPQSGLPGIGCLGSQARPGPPVASERTPRSQGETPSSPLSRRALEGGMGCWEERNVIQGYALQVEGVLPLVELEPLEGDHGARGWPPLRIRHLEGRSPQPTGFSACHHGPRYAHIIPPTPEPGLPTDSLTLRVSEFCSKCSQASLTQSFGLLGACTPHASGSLRP